MTAMPKVGAYAGWHIEFREVTQDLDVKPTDRKDDLVTAVSSSDYYASIDATLPATLDGGSYTFVIEGMTSEDYARLFKATRRDNLLVARLHLYWRDAGTVGYLVDLAGLTDSLQGDEPPDESLVAVLRVTKLKRCAGRRRYEVVIEASELVYQRLLRPIPKKGTKDDSLQAAAQITELLGVTSSQKVVAQITRLLGLNSLSQEDTSLKERSWSEGEIGVKRLGELGKAMERQTEKFGLGMYLIRDGTLYIGPDRLRLVGKTFLISTDDGLIQIEPRGQESEDPDHPDAVPKRDVFELTLRGRPDIKPGDFVEFNRPPDETDELGSAVSFALGVPDVLAALKTRMYVRGVTHHLSRERGFVTVLRGVSIPSGPPGGEFEGWFAHVSPKGPATPEPAQQDDSPAGELAGLVRQHAARGGGRRVDVAQVRASNANGRLPAQTEKLRRGLVADDGLPYAAARLAFDDGGIDFNAAPYASPFAWGKFGLVLPRYPGMRVLLAHRNGDDDDLIDIGALWERGNAPASNPGDYWLVLPAAIHEADRQQVADDQKPKEAGGKATNDLIDADGNRIIEVGKLTVRIGTGFLQDAGTRPTVEPAPLHIEHKNGGKIVIDQNGDIRIEAKKDLMLLAPGGKITIEAKGDVEVKTDGVMDVKGRN